MQTCSISVTDAARNFSDCVNRARYQGVTFILHRNGVPVARIVPEGKAKQTPTRGVESGDTAPAQKIKHSDFDPSRSLW